MTMVDKVTTPQSDNAFSNAGKIFFSDTKFQIFALALLYVIGGWLGLQLAVPPGYATMIWPPSGIALAALLILGRRLWLGILLGSLLVNMIIGKAIDENGVAWIPLLNAALIAMGSTTQALLASLIVRNRFGFPITLPNIRSLAELFVICGPLSCVIAPTFGVISLWMTGTLPASAVLGNWMTWWLGDMMGVLIVTPIALLSPWRKWEIIWRGAHVANYTVTMVAGMFMLMGATLVAWKVASIRNYERTHDAFMSMAQEHERALFNRAQSYGRSLDAGAAFFVASEHVTLKDWRTFVASLDVGRSLPGISGVGYVAPVKDADIPRFMAQARKDGAGDFEIHPKTDAAYHYVIKYLEPEQINRRAVGLDITFEPNRRSAADKARDTGMPTITKHIFLVQDIVRQPGFLLLKPVYRSPEIPQSVAARRKAFEGWVYAPFIASRFMHGITASQGDTLQVRIVDGWSNEKDLIFDSGVEAGHMPAYSITKRIRLFQQEWTLTWASTAEFERANRTWEPWIVLLSGLCITGIFGILLLSYTRREAYVRQEVGMRTVDLVEREKGLQEALAALRISERKFSALAGLSPAGIFRTDNFGFCTFVNDAWLQAAQLRPHEAMGAGWIAAIHEEDRQRVYQGWLASIGLAERFRIEFRFCQGDGKTTWIDLISGPEHDESGNVVGFIGVASDITERKSLEQDMIVALENAEQATRAKSSFLANMSHELRTPMNGVIGFAELLLHSELKAEQRRHLDLVLDSSRAMMSLLNDILDFSKIEAGEMKLLAERLDVVGKIRRCAAVLEPLATSKGLILNVVIAANTPRSMMVDPLRFRQILMNILGNAIKFTDRGRIDMRASLTGNGTMLIEVEDTGIGIAQDRQASIFERFVQADDGVARRYGGSGLGLAISSSLARLMGGNISLRSTLGQGTVVSLELPVPVDHQVQDETSLEDQSPSEDHKIPSAHSVRLLLAEDHDINQLLLCDMLNRLGHEVEVASNGAQAVQMALASQRRGADYQIILMDVQMPIMDGLEATRQIREAGLDAVRLPIVALSANAYPEDVDQCLAAGMQTHVAKPVQMRMLDDVIRRWATTSAIKEGVKARKRPFTSVPAGLAARYARRRQDGLAMLERLAHQDMISDVEIEELKDMLHKLAGSAGMFGEEQLGRFASAIEHDLPNWTGIKRTIEAGNALALLQSCSGQNDTDLGIESWKE